MLSLFDQLQLPVCCLLDTALYEYGPNIPEAFRRRGDEVIPQGHLNNKRRSFFIGTEERAKVAEITALVGRHEGNPPRGWFSPWIAASDALIAILKERGYEYLLDPLGGDGPVWADGPTGPFLLIPYSQHLDDVAAATFFAAGGIQFADSVMSELEQACARPQERPSVAFITLHPYLSGQPLRLHLLRRVLLRILERKDQIWITRPNEIYSYIRHLESRIERPFSSRATVHERAMI